jgi:hypothetical protein
MAVIMTGVLTGGLVLIYASMGFMVLAAGLSALRVRRAHA